MGRWRLITIPLLTVLPFGLAGLLGARHTPSTLPPCLEAVETVDFERSPIDGLWVRQIQISNCGGGPVALDDVAIDAPGHAAGFTVLGPTAGHIDVDTPLTLNVGFTPERIGNHSGALRVAVGGRSLVEIDLVGEGILPGGIGTDDSGCAATLPGGFIARGACGQAGLRLSPAMPIPLGERPNGAAGLAPVGDPPSI